MITILVTLICWPDVWCDVADELDEFLRSFSCTYFSHFVNVQWIAYTILLGVWPTRIACIKRSKWIIVSAQNCFLEYYYLLKNYSYKRDMSYFVINCVYSRWTLLPRLPSESRGRKDENRSERCAICNKSIVSGWWWSIVICVLVITRSSKYLNYRVIVGERHFCDVLSFELCIYTRV